MLPLENLSREPDQEFFADGMTEELITELARNPALRVISRTSVARYKGSTKSVREIGRELNVDAVVEGSVLRAGDQARITLKLVEVATDRRCSRKATRAGCRISSRSRARLRAPSPSASA